MDSRSEALGPRLVIEGDQFLKVSQEKARALRRIALASTLMLLFVAIWLPITTAQEAEQDTDPFPLRPADTSSPRATLQTFLTNVEDVIDGLWRETLKPADIRAYDRAVRTLDFTTTVNGNSSAEQTRRILLLAELLADVACEVLLVTVPSGALEVDVPLADPPEVLT